MFPLPSYNTFLQKMYDNIAWLVEFIQYFVMKKQSNYVTEKWKVEKASKSEFLVHGLATVFFCVAVLPGSWDDGT